MATAQSLLALARATRRDTPDAESVRYDSAVPLAAPLLLHNLIHR